MAVKGKGKQIATAASSSTAGGKRKKPTSAAARRKKKRSGVLQFFDDAAVDAESEDSDDDFSDLEDEQIDLGTDFTGHSQKGKDAKGAGKLNTIPFFIKEEELSGDELEELIRDRYGHGSEHVVYDDDTKQFDDIHTMKEPPIWKIKCRVGWERKIAFSLMQKYIDLQELGTKMKIISIFSVDHVQGYVYIEAEKANDISEACKGLCSLYLSRMGLVPRNEVPHLLCTRNKSYELVEGAWVRLKNGSYKGDLAQVVAVDNGQRRAMVKLIPRINLQALAKKFGGGVSLKQAAVPTPRLIRSSELEDFRSHIQTRRDCQTGEFFDVLDGLMLKNGYLYKKVSFGSLILWGVQPSDAEREKFVDSSKDEAEDLNWISSVYDGRKKMRLGEVSDHKLDTEKTSGCHLLDLVLFGRKAFGVIIAMDGDSFQVLKGDADGPEAVTVQRQEIKNVCIDKMFKAADHHTKIISLNDVVKVLEGPLQGRQGIVRHMYRGTLFIYDENQSENCGIFCVSSTLCENVTDPKNSYGGKSRNKSSSSFAKSPTRSFQQDDESGGFNRHSQSNTNSTFSIGQTLRIRKGPLKGYLCRVVRIYRSDVTVKLDSLVKVITVQEQLLSVPNFRSDDSAAITSGGGTQNGQSFGLSGDGAGASADGSTWAAGLLSSTRDPWQGRSTFGLLAGNNDDRNTDQEKGGDPWSSKVSVGHDQALDGWDKPISSSGEQNEAWNKSKVDNKTIDDANDQAGNQERVADVWNRDSTKSASTGTEGWEKAKFPSNGAMRGGSWGNDSSKGGNQVDHSNNASGQWESQKSNISTVAGWDKAVKGKGVSLDQGSSWAHSGNINHGKADSWDIKGKGMVRNEDTKWGTSSESQEKIADESRDRGNRDSSWDLVKVPSTDHRGNWKESNDTSEKDSWARKVGHSSNDRVEVWNKPRSFGGDQVSSWDKPKAPIGGKFENWEKVGDKHGDEKGGWGKAVSSEGLNDGWCKSKTVGDDPEPNWSKQKNTSDKPSDSWSMAKDDHKDERGGWNKEGFSDQTQSDGWCKPKTSGGDQVSSWGKADTQSGGDNWSKSIAASNVETGGWNRSKDDHKDERGGRNKEGVSDMTQRDGWCKPKTSGGDQVSSWGKADAPSGGDNWSKSKSANNVETGGWNKAKDDHKDERSSWNKEGFSSDQAQLGGWCKPKTSGGDQVSCWDKADIPSGGDNWCKSKTASDVQTSGWHKAEFSSQGQTNIWDKPKSFCDSLVSTWNRGDDDEASRNNQRSKWDNSSNFGGGRGFGRGRGGGRGSGWGRGRDGNGGNEDEQNVRQRDPNDGGGFSRGRGRGRFSSGGSGDQDGSWKRPGDSDGGWGRGRGRGGGRNESGESRDDFGGTRSFGRSHVHSDSDGWGVNQSGAWDRQKSFGTDEGSKGESNLQGGWSRGKSSDGNCSSGWKNNPEDSSSGWNKGTGRSKESWGSTEKSDRNKGGDGQSSGCKQESSLRDGYGGGWNRTNPSSSSQSFGWNNDKRELWNATKAYSGTWNSVQGDKSAGKEAGTHSVLVEGGWCKAEASENQSSGWMDNRTTGSKEASKEQASGNWVSAKVSVANPSSGWNSSSAPNDSCGKASGVEDKWSQPNTFDGKRPSSWSSGSGVSEKTMGEGVAVQDAANPPGVDRTSSWANDGRKDWNNDEGGWNKPKSFSGDQSSTWNDRSSVYKGESGNTDRSVGWNSGRSFGGDQPSGWRGNTFSNRGRGRGRNFGGRGGGSFDRQNGGQDVGDTSNQPKSFGRGQSSGWNQEGFRKGGNGDQGGYGGWEGGKDSYSGQPSGGDSHVGGSGGWGTRGSDGKAAGEDGGKGSAGNNWDRAKGSDGGGDLGWNVGGSSSAAKEFTAGQPEGWNQKNGSDGATGSGCWMGGGAGSGRQVDGWNGRESGSGERKSDWHQGAAVKEGDAGGAKGSSAWEKEPGGWGKGKDEGGHKGGW